jgi:hypothetical protein
MVRRRRGAVELPTVARFDRGEFIATRWDHRAGEHVTILAPSGWGKTTLAFDLLRPLSTPDEPTVILVMKPRDSTVDKFGKEMKFRKVRQWPPPAPYGNRRSPLRPPGFLLWPRFTGDPEIDEHRQYHEFRAALLSSMKRGRGVKVFADEVADLQEIKLGRTVNHFLRQGRSLTASLVTATQRPFGAPGMIYGGAMHLFIGNDPDRRSQLRYEEIGGVDPDVVTGVTAQLAQYEWLYIRRTRDRSPTVMCIVGA